MFTYKIEEVEHILHLSSHEGVGVSGYYEQQIPNG